MTPTKPEDALVERLRGPFNYDPGAMQDALLEAADAITTLLERERRAVEAMREGHDTLARLLDYALAHDTALIENDDAGKQSPLVTDSKSALAAMSAALTQPNPDREV